MRIRTIKPAVCTSRTVARLSSDSVRLHWERLWMYADDDGRGIDDPRLIKAALFPLDDKKTLKAIDGYQAELEAEGMIVRYETKGERVFAIPGFKKHQRIDRPKPSEIPPPDAMEPGALGDESPNDQRNVTDGTAQEVEVEGKGDGREQGTGLGKEGKSPTSPYAFGNARLTPKEIEATQHPRFDEFAARIAGLCQTQSTYVQRTAGEAAAKVLAVLDHNLVDECVHYCENLTRTKVHSPAFLLTTMEAWGQQRGVVMPSLRKAKAS